MASVAISLAVGFAAQTAAYFLQPTRTIDNGGLSDLSIPKSNYGVVIPQGWGTVAVAGNLIWGTHIEEVVKKKKKRGKGGGGTVEKERTYFGNAAWLFGYTPNSPAASIKRIWMNGKIVYSTVGDAETINNGNDFAQKYLRFYLGSATQNPDPLLESLKPSSAYDYGLPHDPNERAQALAGLGLDPNTIYTPAYRYRVYCVAERLPLNDFGNQLPTVKAEVVFSNNPTLATVISDICLQAGLESGQIDVTGLENIPVTGFYLDSITKAHEALQLLQQCYFFDIIQSQGKLIFLPQSANRPVELVGGLAAHVYGQERPQTYTEEPEYIEALPAEVDVNFLDPDLDYEENTAKARSQVSQSKEKKVYNLPIVLKADEAIALAEKILHQFYLTSRKFSFTLPPAYSYLEVGDRVSLFYDGEVLKITEINLGANLLNQVKATLFDSVSIATVSISRTVETGGYNSPLDNNVITTPGNTELLVLDIPLISDQDPEPGVYLTGGGGSRWTGADIYASINGSTYELVAGLETYGVYGEINSFTPSEIQVTLTKGELASVQAEDLAIGANKALVGAEIIQFTNAQNTSENVYTLTGLIRGLRGTEWVESHEAGERFVLLTGEDSYLERITNSRIQPGQNLYFKALSVGQTLDEVTPVVITYQGNDLKPYSPVNLAATKDEAGNITITWDRRDRRAGEETDLQKIPLSETREEYRLAFVGASDPIRTITTNKNSYTYLAEAQITDFGSIRSSITVGIGQMSTVYGEGTRVIALLTPTLVPGLPVIKSFTPVQGEPGITVTVTGSGFTGVSSVAVNSITSEFTIDSDSQITFTLSANATSGFIEVVKSNGTAISDVPFIIAADPGDYMESTEFITSSTGLIKASKIEAAIGGIPLTFFRSVTSSRSLQDDDLGAILNCDTSQSNITITLDETLISNPVGFNCYLRNIGTGIITITATNFQAIDNRITEQWAVARVSFENGTTWLMYGDLAENSTAIKNKLQTLTGSNRLDVTAIKNLRQGHNITNDLNQNFTLRNRLKFDLGFTVNDDSAGDRTVVNFNKSDSIVDGLLAYYRFENSYQDSTGRIDLTGILDSTITYSAGRVGNQIVFQGNETLEGQSSLLQLGYGNFSISFWFSISQLGQFYTPVAIHDSNGNSLFTFTMPTDNKPIITFNGSNSLTSSTAINTLGFHHFVITYFFWRERVSLWVDGQQRANGNITITPFTNPSKLILGKNATVTIPQGTGMDSLAIWTRFLADSEIDYLFTGTEIANAINASPDVNNILTPLDIRDNLETLTGDDRLDISAIKNVPDPTIRVNSDYFRRVENHALTLATPLLLTNESPEYQYIDPNGSDNIVQLPSNPSTGKFFQITNINPINRLNIQESNGQGLFLLYTDASYERNVADCTYDGSGWKIIVW